MNENQEKYLKLIQEIPEDNIMVKETGKEEISLRPHSHKKDQIIFTTSGTLRINVDGRDFFIPEHHITWIPAGKEHTVSSNNRQVSAVIVYCNSGSTTSPAVYQSGEHVGGILKFMRESCPEVISKSGQPEIYDFIISFIHVIPLMCKVSLIPLTKNLVPEDNRIRPILDYIAAHSNEELRIPDIARRFGYSERNLSRLFKLAGIKFTNCVNTHRITRAIEMMAEGNMSVREIAYSVGFNSPSGFNRVFKQITGRNPGEFYKGNS